MHLQAEENMPKRSSESVNLASAASFGLAGTDQYEQVISVSHLT